MKFYDNINKENRQAWLKNVLSSLPAGYRILDAGAGELRNRELCNHLDYVSQDFCQYDGIGDVGGLHQGKWDTTEIDIRSDIINIPQPDASFDVILCSEVLEHIPDPMKAIKEFNRLLRRKGKLILTAPFASLVHFAPYHYYSGFSKYWYEYHLPKIGFTINELVPNGDWFSYFLQELMRLGSTEKKCNNYSWPLAYILSIGGVLYFKMRSNKKDDGLACFGWHCVAEKNN